MSDSLDSLAGPRTMLVLLALLFIIGLIWNARTMLAGDRGGQCASLRHRAVLRRAGVQQGASAAAHCWDNAFLKSCFGAVKTELEMVDYATPADAVRELTAYVRDSNIHRRHSSLGYWIPEEFGTRTAVTQ